MAYMLPSLLATLLVGAYSHALFLECGTDASTRLRVGQTIMQSTVEDAPADSPVKVEVQGSTVTVSLQAGITFAAKAFGKGATISPVDTSLRLTRDCANQVYTARKSSTYSFTHNKAESIVVGYHKPGLIPFAPGRVYLVTAKVPTTVTTLSNVAVALSQPSEGALPSPGDIEKMLCKVAGNKAIEDMVTKQVCTLAEKHFQIPNCQADAEKAWGMVANMCPKPTEEMMLATAALPSPGDIEKMFCQVAGNKAMEGMVTLKVCTLAQQQLKITIPDCQADAEKAWDMVANMCPKPSGGFAVTLASAPKEQAQPNVMIV
jgi:hypothetical protein